jgi:hypothetical protein
MSLQEIELPETKPETEWVRVSPGTTPGYARSE